MAGSGSNPFQHLEKSAVLQEACIFNDTFVSLSRCLHILTHLLNPHMVKKSYVVVKHWVNEGQEAASADNITVQDQALGLLYHLRKNDCLAVTKMLNKFTESFK